MRWGRRPRPYVRLNATEEPGVQPIWNEPCRNGDITPFVWRQRANPSARLCDPQELSGGPLRILDVLEHITRHDDVEPCILIRQRFAGTYDFRCVEGGIAQDGLVEIATVDMGYPSAKILQKLSVADRLIVEEFSSSGTKIQKKMVRSDECCHLSKERNLLIDVRETAYRNLLEDAPLGKQF